MPTKRVRSDWHHEDVKAAIRKTGVSLSELARQHGYSISAIKMTLRRPSVPVQTIIAKHLGVLPQVIWPTRYDERGEPISRHYDGGGPRSRHRSATQRKFREAI
jgi:Ner family transcriptional regulator